jgi:hypothetical protein
MAIGSTIIIEEQPPFFVRANNANITSKRKVEKYIKMLAANSFTTRDDVYRHLMHTLV